MYFCESRVRDNIIFIDVIITLATIKTLGLFQPYFGCLSCIYYPGFLKAPLRSYFVTLIDRLIATPMNDYLELLSSYVAQNTDEDPQIETFGPRT